MDGLLRAGTDKFKNECQRTHEVFEMSAAEKLPSTFAGFQISGDKAVDQKHYIRQREELPVTASFSDFRSMPMKLAGMNNSCSDCFVDVSLLAQITEETRI